MVHPVTLAVLRGRLEQIADEMDAALFRSAFNPIIAEARDASHGLYHPETGATLIQGQSGLPIFVGAMAFAVKSVIGKIERDGNVSPGDVYFFNDPYEGATHLNDFKLIRPVFRDGNLFCFLASVGHWHDVGGNVPGNYNPVATESFQEGFRVPPVKLYEAGKLNQDIVDIVLANTRLPTSCYGDLNAQVNSLELGETRLHALLEEYGDEVVRETLGELTQSASRLMRANIEELPDGVYEAEDFLDNDGKTDEPLPIRLALTVKGSTLKFDFSGTAKQCDGPLNISYATAIAGCYVALKHIFKEVPANGGCLEPIEFIIPEDSVLHAKAPKPVGGYTETVLRLIDVVFLALSQSCPTKVNGSAYGTINALSLAGYRQDGKRWVMFSFFGGGLGGNPEGNGLNHGNAPISTATIPPAEILESAYPVAFTQWGLRPDSGGAGEKRGGLGAIYEIELLEKEAELFFFGERGRFAPKGVLGGGEAAKTVFSYEADGQFKTPELVSKLVGKSIREGERVRIESPGGGGYGDPKKRLLEDVARDVQLGYVTPEAAVRDYGVELEQLNLANEAIQKDGEVAS